jgi:hypothetical protein
MGLPLRPAWKKSLARDMKEETSFGIGILPLGHCSYSFLLQQVESSNPDSLWQDGQLPRLRWGQYCFSRIIFISAIPAQRMEAGSGNTTGSSSTSRKDDINIGTVVDRHFEDCQLNGIAKCR